MQLIALGSSVGANELGPPQAILRLAVSAMTRRLGAIHSISRLYGTTAWPDPTQPSYVNAALTIDTDLTPNALLGILLEIELEFGRQRSVPNAPRTLDLDLIADDQHMVASAGLTLPHPRMQDRAFVLEPMCDVWPNWVHPRLGMSAQSMLDQLKASPDYRPEDIWVLDG